MSAAPLPNGTSTCTAKCVHGGDHTCDLKPHGDTAHRCTRCNCVFHVATNWHFHDGHRIDLPRGVPMSAAPNGTAEAVFTCRCGKEARLTLRLGSGNDFTCEEPDGWYIAVETESRPGSTVVRCPEHRSIV